VALLGGDDSFDETWEVDDSQPIGKGKFSDVYSCWRRNNPSKRYALKVIHLKHDDHQTLTRIYEEIEIMKVLGNHPSLVQLVAVDDSSDAAMRVVLELCEGGELYARIHQKQCYPENEAKLMLKQILEAIAYIHSKGIMHRDLKPENILLESKASNVDIKVSDFGLAKQSKDYPRRLPRSHSICGSDYYLAPEVIKQEEYGREIDIWSAGVIAFVVLSGSLPFFNVKLEKLYRAIIERDLQFPAAQWNSVGKGAQDFILRLLQVRAGDRLTAEQALNHPWLRGVGTSEGGSFNSWNNPRGRGMSPASYGGFSRGASGSSTTQQMQGGGYSYGNAPVGSSRGLGSTA
jgi:serine/threonine protein kinase